MATDSIIPRRPAGIEIKIPGKDKDILEYSAVFNVPNNEAFLLFNPQFITADGKLNNEGKRRCRDFFSYTKNREYKEAYTELLKGIVGGQRQESREKNNEIDDSRKDNALKSLLNQAMSLVERGEDLDPDTLKVIAEIYKKIGILKEEVEQEVRPVRFLPERCFSGCRYRLFIENAVKGGAVIDECQYCKALAYATENGYKDDATKRLDIPKEILDAEPENTIKTLDILSGKVDN